MANTWYSKTLGDGMLTDPLFEGQLDAYIQQAQMDGLNSVPKLVFADTHLVSGGQPVKTLRRVVEQVQDGESSH